MSAVRVSAILAVSGVRLISIPLLWAHRRKSSDRLANEQRRYLVRLDHRVSRRVRLGQVAGQTNQTEVDWGSAN